MLGGAHAQVPSIQAAVGMGYHVISCDYLPGNPGHRFAHEYHNVSTTDKEAVLGLAKRLRVDGVVCYASDPAATTAAYVCEQMGFPTSPYRSVEILSNKDLFRRFLKDNHFNVPWARGYARAEDAIREIRDFRLPVMVKPVDSSGSKGITKLERAEDLPRQIEYALSFSRAKRFVVEEFVEGNGRPITGDGFSVDGELVFRCFADDHFDARSRNPFYPFAASWPYSGSEQVQDKIHGEIQRLLRLLGMKTGAYNFDVRVGDNDAVFLMEVGARNGGDFLPQVTRYATGVDLVEYTIRAAMGLDCSDLGMKAPEGFWGCYGVHSPRGGVLGDVWIDDAFRRDNLVEMIMYFNKGDTVHACMSSSETLGAMILQFESRQEMMDKLWDMQRWVRVDVDSREG